MLSRPGSARLAPHRTRLCPSAACTESGPSTPGSVWVSWPRLRAMPGGQAVVRLGTPWSVFPQLQPAPGAAALHSNRPRFLTGATWIALPAAKARCATTPRRSWGSTCSSRPWATVAAYSAGAGRGDAGEESRGQQRTAPSWRLRVITVSCAGHRGPGGGRTRQCIDPPLLADVAIESVVIPLPDRVAPSGEPH